jgi:glutathione synthase
LVDVDDFVRQLWDLYLEVKKEGTAQVHLSALTDKTLSLGLFRSDYMIHVDPTESSPTPEIKQVEFNTISSSFGGLSSQVTQLHQYLFSIGAYGPNTPITRESLPDNPAAAKLAEGLAAAHNAYNSSSAAILFIVQDPERNAFDQRWLEYHLLSTHGIQIRRHTLVQIASVAKIDDERRLWVHNPTKGSEWREISVVYFRAGYGPGDYPSKTEWEARRMLERSMAIKCPTVITQLAGCKKVQQVLASTGELER